MTSSCCRKVDYGCWWSAARACSWLGRKWINYRSRRDEFLKHDSKQKIYLIFFDNVMTAARGHIASRFSDFNLRFLRLETLNLLTWIALISLQANYLKHNFLSRIAQWWLRFSFNQHSPVLRVCLRESDWGTTKAKRENHNARWLIGDLSIANGFEHRNVIRLTGLCILRAPRLCSREMSHLLGLIGGRRPPKKRIFDTCWSPSKAWSLQA